MDKMFIPKRIKIGFQKRDDTFTEKLSYIIYYDEKGKLRKEASWNTWIDKSIESVEFDNVPQAGYLFNKGVKRDGYWGSGRSVIRVYDPRDFEFEISVDNLMGILMHSDVSKRDIIEECVFAWAGKELVLLPVNSQEYIESVEYTKKQDQKITSKDLVEGYVYQAKKLDTPLTYIGYREWFDFVSGYVKDGKITSRYDYSSNNRKYIELHESKGKKHIFFDGSKFITKTAPDLSSILSAEVVNDYSDLVERFFKTINSQKVVSVSGNKNAKGDLYHYYNYLYYITEGLLFTIEVKQEHSPYNHKTQGHNYRPQLRYSTKAIEYPNSMQFVSDNRILSAKEFKDIEKEFNKVFCEFVANEKLSEKSKEAVAWLLERNIFKGYNLVLENGSEIARSY